MGLKLAELFVSVGADTRQYDAAMTALRANIQRTSGGLRRLAIAARNVFAVGAAGIGGILVAVGSYEKAMARVEAVLGATREEMSALDSVVRELGANSLFSAREVANAARVLAIAGFDLTTIMESLPAIMHLAAAGTMEVEMAADHAVKVMKGMGVSGKELGLAVDMMSKAFTSANTDLHQFAEALTYVGPISKLTGYAMNEVGSAIMIVSNAGIQAERAGTGLRRFLAELSRQASPTRNAMLELGVALMDVSGQLRPLPDIIEDFGKVLDEQIPPAQRLGKMIDIFGLRAGPAVAALLDVGAKKMREYEALLAGAGGTAEHLANIQLQTLIGRLTQLKNRAFEVSVAFGNVLLPTVKMITDGFKKLQETLISLNPVIRENIAAFVVLSTVFSALVLTLIKVGSVLSFITSHPLFALITGLAALVVGMLYARSEGETMAEKFKNIWETVRPTWEAFVSVVINGITWAWGHISNWIAWLQVAIPAAWEAVLDYMYPIIYAMWTIISSIWNAIGKYVMSAMKFIAGVFAKAWNWIADHIGGIMEVIQIIIVTGLASVSFAIDNWRELLSYSILFVSYHVVKFANQVKYFFTEVLPSVLHWFAENFVDIMVTVGRYIKTIFTNIGKNIANFVIAVKDALTGKEWDFEWTKLTDGFESEIKKWPGIANREIGGLEADLGGAVDYLGKRINKKWDKHITNIWDKGTRKKPLDLGEDLPTFTEPEISGEKKKEEEERARKIGKVMGDSFGGSVKKSSIFVGLEQKWRDLQAAAIGKEDIQKRQLEQLQEINKGVKDLPKSSASPLIGP
jgi:TP901 family phage tail tape measure protein